MKHYYYYSNRNCKYVRIRNFRLKFLFTLTCISLITAIVISAVYLSLNNKFEKFNNPHLLSSENSVLEYKLDQLNKDIRLLNNELGLFSSENEYLRLACNLDPISINDKVYGVGGSQFSSEEVFPYNDLSERDSYLKISKNLENLHTLLSLELNSSAEISEKIEINEEYYSSIPAIMPTIGTLNDRFGMRRHPILGIRKMHTGIDIRNNTGTPVFAPGDGVISFVGYKGGYGLVVEIDHGFSITTLFGHLSKTLVEIGDDISRGEKIALSGRSGRLVTGPHLHYEVRLNGIPQNPSQYIISSY